ncbi:T9SS type B sorting domain-containing protein [Cellulophaga baltica]|uniref:T9SS type B sorting domain-containing protein n=1 Tax=Cellulophaga baltica TaxID=76594 RepID=UPI0021497780|nr:T9SS type B sorting domain-containing protein [Cellulophaga baltica]MCR1023178.1 T9SS type B sorting domain-containing protein [Cellulophaga baltica]
MKTLFQRKSLILLALLSFAGATQFGYSQEYTPFTRTYPSGDNFRYQNNIKGDLIFIANNIVNRDGGTATTEPEDAYNNQNVRIDQWWLRPSNYYDNETGGFNNYNDSKNMQYIDVDSDTSTFSSSSASLDFPEVDCNLIRYAALYWSATYPSEQASQTLGTNRQNDFNSVKLKIPGGSYVDITADEILYDGFTAADNQNRANSPYACYAEITNLLTPIADPTGEYTVANVRSVTGQLAGGASGGWTLVIVYENPTLSGKLITTFDGFARVNSGNPNVDINYSGFKTIPSGPVNANIGAAALEGDFAITGDRLRIREKTTDPFTTISNGANPSNNFFNSNISSNGSVTTNRNPNSINTLGYDTDIFKLTNSGNSIIDNDATQATFRFTSNGDQYYPFFNSFNIEIIEPKIILEKKVTNLAETVDLTGSGVNLGDNLKYILSFENVGNDDATSYTIRDVLPQNVTLDEAALSNSGNLPPGVTYVFDAATRTIVFTIPDNLVVEGAPVASIRMQVKVAENCFDFVNACTNQIQNLAYSTYQGVDNDNVITDDPSVTDFDSCGFITPGATNFLLDDLSDCDFSRTVQLCGDNVLLDAGDNFDDYIWYRDVNENNVIDLGVDTVLNDGNPDGDLSTLTVTEPGIYIVDKIVADPCKGFQEIITVEFFGTTQTNPIIDFFNDRNGDADITNDIQGEILRCSIDGEYLANIFLCGSTDTELIQVNIPDAVSLEWQELNSSCTSSDPSCPNKGNSCYSTVATGNAFTLTDTGDYRLVINYLNGCSSRYYFSAFKNDLPVTTTSTDIFCDTDGNITVTNLGSGYGFELINLDTNSIQVPFSANNGNSFDIDVAGNYRVDIRQLDASGNPIANSCEFQSQEIGIRDRDFTVNLSTTPENCYALGTINVQTLNVRANYTYDLRFNDGTTHAYGTGTRVNLVTAQTTNNYTFNNLNPDDYTLIVTTQDGCTSTQNITVTKIDDLRLTAALTANIGCTAGTITLTPQGGFPNPEYSYAIWSVNGVDLYSTLGDVPASEYTTDPIFKFGYRDTDGDGIDEYFAGEEGTYEFIVVDANNCFIASNSVTIEDLGNMTIGITDDSPVTCSGNNDASITITTTNGVGPFQYSIDAGATYQDTGSFVGLAAGTYDIIVSDDSGCTVVTTHTITETATLSASAGVSRDVTCDPAGAEVRITNVVGGQAPYTYSFNGGTTFGTASTAILPPGNYNTVVVKDALGCEFAMDVYVEDYPVEPVITPVVDYNCDGSGNITLNSDISTYNYTYAIDGVLNTPDADLNIFSDIAAGTYTITTNYTSQTPPTPSLLLVENFGSGSTTSSTNTVGYTYEDQTGNAPGDSNSNINDYEYTVTSQLVAPYGSWINPIDHTTGTRTGNGRYLVINVGTPATGQVIYTKTISDIIPNQPLRVSLWILNLLKSTSSGLDPNLIIEVQETGTGTPVQTIYTGDIAKNTGSSDWTEFSVDLNPGSNTTLEFVIRTDKVGNDGNDVAIDDIEIFQIPEVCELFVESLVTVEDDRAFEANYLSSTNVTCFGDTNGTITFEVVNFDPTTGFEYTTDGVNYTTSLVSPVTTPQVLGAGVATIDIRKVDDVTCVQQITRTITQPSAVNTTAVISNPFTCSNTGATITANATGGTPTYVYQLEDTAGTIIGTYDYATNGANKIFTNVTAGDYIVRARDNSGCEDPINTAITITAPTALTFTATPSVCYSGASDGTITVNASGGNGGLLFSINNGPFVAPTPTTASSYVFNNLASGTYIINVKDELGCTTTPQNITIAPELSVTASANAITTCGTSTDVTITATGGDANYVYAIVADGVTPLASDFAVTNPIAIAAAGDYDVYVRDHAGATGFCFDMFDITIIKNAPIAITETLTDVTCFGGNDGAIALAVTGGNAPYRYSIDNGTTYQTISSNFPNLAAGTYQVLVQDADLCTQPLSVVINEPNAITAEAVQTKDYTCLPAGEAEITVGSITPTAGGSGDYQYSINGGTWTASTTGGTVFTGLTDGTYTIRVRDAAATTCVVTLSDVIIDPLPIAPTLTSSVTYNCEGTGNITISPFDASYTYSIDGATPQTGATANVFNTVATGNHTIEVNYGNECTTQIIVNVANGRAFTASISTPININCFGESNGAFTINASNFGTAGFEYSLDGTNFVGPFTSAETVTGLTAQNYSITVRDVSSPTTCTIPLTQNLTQPNAITATASITTPFTCANTGATITAVANGGTPTYTYQLETNLGAIIRAYQPTATFNNVPANASGENYVVRILDSRNCTNVTLPAVTVDAPEAPTFTATPTACYSGASDGEIVVNVTGGNGNLVFSIDNGPFVAPTPTTAFTYTFTNLASGDHIINVQDGYGCSAATQTITINPELSVTASANAITTCGISTDVTITATGGDANYVYAIVADGVTPLASDFAITNPIAIAAAGDYDVYVRDHAGATGFCFDMFDITIIKNAPIAITETLTDVTCFGGNDGAIALAVTGGNAPYRYSIDNGTTYQTISSNFPNLAAGTYQVLVQDADLCTQPLSVVINEPNAITAEAVQTKDYTCLPAGEAEITVGSITPTAGGSGDYQYSINGGTWTASTTGGTVFTGLTDGTYTIRVRDAAATTCVVTLSDVIIDPLPIAPTLTSSVTYNCEGTGNITISPFDASYTYSIDGATPQTGATANVFNTVATGNHTIEVNYGNECTTQIIVNVANGRAFTASISTPININCFGESNGAFTINASNFGTAGFEYSLDGTNFVGPFTSAETVTGLTAQNYSITVRDVSSPTTCTIPLTQNLTQPNAITATASITTPFTCANTGATITAVANGGTPTYTYQLETNLGTIIRAYQPTATFNNVPANASGENYVVRILDSRNCTNVTLPAVTVDAPEVPTFTATPTACYSGANDGTIQVDITSIPGNENFQFSINGGAWITPSPVSATTYTFTGLANGSYTIDVKDGYGCDALQETVVLSPQLVVTTTVVDVSSCNDGSITVNATGGNGTLVYAIVPANTDPTGLYTTTNNLTVTNAMATANPAGYDVYVLDNNGVSSLCSYTEEDIIVNTAATLTISGTPTDPECYDGLGSIDALAAGGNMPYTYALTDLSPADGIDYSVSYSNINTTTNAFSGIGVGDYEITITDANGCAVTSATITINNAVEITADIAPILPADCVGSSPNDYGFEFQNLITPTATLVEYSFDNGSTWNTDGVEQRNLASGTTVYPSIRVTLASGTICQKDFPRYIIPYPLDDLDISLSAIVVDCNDLQVTVQGTAGSAPYEYAYSEDPSTFNPATATWVPGGTEDESSGSTVTVPAGHGNYTWLGLTPGRTYVFYVRDATGCVRQSLENVNDLVAPLPIDISTAFSPTCFGASTGEITYTLNPSTPNTHMRWEFYELGNPTPIEVSGGGAVAANIIYNNTITLSNLPQGEYYIEVQQSDGTTDSCRGGSENVLIDQLRELTATATPTRDISCNLPGLITVSNITGGGGAPYTFDVTGPAGFTAVTDLTSNPIQIPVNSPAGDYTVTLNDQYGCPVTLAPVTLGLSPNPTIAVTQDNCAAPISLTATGTSAAGNLRYAIVAAGDPMPTNYLDNNGLFTNVTPGTYDVYVIDGNGCTAVEPAYIVNPVLSAKAELTKLLDCTGTPDATITIEALTGSGNYDYSISGAATVTQTTLTSPFVYDASVAGDYVITIYDTATPNSTNCNRVFTVNVPVRVEPVISATAATPITCIGDNDGTITITAVDNGTGPYTFEITSLDGVATSITPTSFTNTTAEFTGLVPTTTADGYVVTVTGDATTNACTTDSAAILIAEPAAVVVTIDPLVDVVQFTCTPSTNTENNASITVNSVTGGSNNFVRYVFVNNAAPGTPVQDGSNASYIETNRAGGTYTITAYDDNGCIGTATATIDAFDELLTADAIISSAITCSPGNDGEVTINVTSTTNDVSKFEYSIDNGATWQTSISHTNPEIFTGLGVGTHNFLVRHTDTDCELFTSINITDPNTFTIATPVTTDVICIGTATGTATFTVADATYTGTYSWEVFDDNDTPTNYLDDTSVQTGTSADFTATALLAGGYYVTFSQDGVPTCDNREPFSIAEPTNALAAGTPIASPITCVPGSDGSIEIVNVTGGWGGYAYYVSTTANPDPTDASNYVATPKFENLTAGTYEIWVIDSRGCSLQLADITLSVPTAITADLQLNNENCSNFEGEVQVINQAGGQGTNYSYQLQRFDGTAYVNVRPIQTTATFSNLGAGEYQVIVSDQWGCFAPTANTITLYEEMVPLATIVKAIDCTVNPGGQITISQTGGNGPFNYTGTFPDGTPLTANTDGIFSALTQNGTYSFTITDATLCSVAISQTLEAAVLPATPTIDAFTNVTCFNAADGTISVSIINNGFDPYTFQITSMDGAVATINPTSTTNTSAVFTGLANTTGTGYEITVTAANSCTTTVRQTIAQPAILDVPAPTITQFVCATGNTDNNATIDLTGLVTGGSGNYVRYVFVNDATPGTPVQDGSNAIYTETNRAGGTYTITVYDDMGCSDTTTATINGFDALLTPTITIDEAISCVNAGEDVTINAFGSITDSSTPAGLANYEFRELPNAFGTTNVFTDLAIGNHVFEVRNINTNCVVTISHTVENPNTFTIATPVTTDVICVGTATGTATFTVADDTYTGTYSWEVFDDNDTPTNYLDDTSVQTGTSADFTATALLAGGYYVTFSQDGVPTCDNREPFNIAEPRNALTAGTPIASPITCVPGSDGSIEIVNVTGGWGGYAYYVSTTANPDPTDASNYVATPKFENLTAGTYEIWVIDSRGCSLQLADITLSVPTAITADLQLNNENCSNFEGEVQVINQAGGQGTNYSYQLQRFDGTAYVNVRPIQTTATFSNLGAGEYQVIVSDQWGCFAPTANAITLYEEMVPLATIVKAIDCTVNPGGQITISQTGGNGPFNYTGTFPDGTPLTANTDGIFSALTQNGTYSFTITDATLCSVAISQTLEAAVLPATPTIDAITNVTCFNAADGTISVSILANGFDPYTFQITSMDGTVATINPTSTTNTSAVFTGLANTTGTGYEITVTGTNSCTTTITQTIAQPAAALTAGTPTVSQFDCTTGNTTNYATIDLTGLVTGGSGNYVRYVFVNDATPGTPVQDGSNANYIETNLAGGTYTITVYDDMGCSDITTATITPFVGISTPTVVIDNTVTCNGNDEDITVGVTITPATALPNLTYVVTSANGYTQTRNTTNSSEPFVGLGIGNYTITVTNNDTGCFVSTTHSVKDPKVIEVTAVKVTDETCINDGVNGGSFNVAIANYTGGYDYQVFLSNGTAYSGILSGNTGTALVIDDLPGGSYYVQITETDATSTLCADNSNVVTINAPEFPITAVVSEQANVSCDNDRGSILVDPSGGKGPYTITIASATQTFTQVGVQAYIFTGLSAGNFAITITDALGCVNDTYSQTLVQPAPLVADISADIALECYGDDTGFVTATVTSGGLGTLQYRLNTYDPTGTVIVTTSAAQTSNTFLGLFSGLYSISVSDTVRCFTETPIATITDPVDVFGSLTMTQSITCVDDLELLLTANGGTAPYSFSTDGTTFTAFNNGNEHIFNALPSGNAGAGTYRYYVQDSFNCTSTLSNEIQADPVAPITITVDETAATISCNGDSSAQLIARASGGLGNYFYELLDTPASTTPLQGPNTNGIFRNLAAGNYYIKVTSEDCEETTTVITIAEPTPLVYTDDYTAVICAGDTNGYINVSLAGGSGDYIYAISPNLAQFDTINSFTDLAPGTYTVIAQDKNGCFVQTEYTITAATPIVIDATPTGETCLGSDDGTIDLILSGGTAPYSTRLENTSYVADMIRYTDLPSGIHTVYVLDDLGCETSIEVTIAEGVNLKATVLPVYECTGDTPTNYLAVTHEDTSVEGLALYQLDDENSADVRLEPNFTNIAPGTHTLIISLNGCIEIIPFTIADFDPLVLSLENNNINEITAIAAGGDGNYTFYFGDRNNEEDNTMYINESGTYTVTVVDGNGCEAIASIEMEFIDIEVPNFFTPNNDLQNDTWIPENLEGFPNILMIIFDRYGREVYRMGANDPGWDGLYQNTELPTGDYWYIIKLQGENDEREFVGHFTLYR